MYATEISIKNKDTLQSEVEVTTLRKIILTCLIYVSLKNRSKKIFSSPDFSAKLKIQFFYFLPDAFYSLTQFKVVFEM